MNLKEIGLMCQEYRKAMGVYQKEIAQDLGCTTQNISAFERGENNNALIYAWYVHHGLYDDSTLTYMNRRVLHGKEENKL